ncbi:MAG: glycosyltransferase family 4 protein [Acidimicrobiales bacterium]
MIRCLLAAPSPGTDDESGDVQYCRDLLAEPPPGVEYVTYPEAMDSGEIRDMPTFRRGAALFRSPSAVMTASVRAGLHGLRRIGMLLPDPVHWWEIVGRFDLIHDHCFALQLSGRVPPVVTTDSAGTFWYWTAARGLGEDRVWALLRRERRLAELIGYVHPTVTPDAAAQALYFVSQGRDLALRLGVGTASITTAPAGVPGALEAAPLALDPPTLLFVARQFDIKGGPEALAVLRRVRSRLPQCRLLVAGSPLDDPVIDGVEWLGPLSREELYEQVYPRADLFVYPTRFDCAPLVVAEALAHGIPVVAPAAFGLPDLVRTGTTGVLVEPGRTGLLADAVLALLRDPLRLRRLGTCAREDFEVRLSTGARNRLLSDAYTRALAHSGHRVR